MSDAHTFARMKRLILTAQSYPQLRQCKEAVDGLAKKKPEEDLQYTRMVMDLNRFLKHREFQIRKIGLVAV